MPKIIDNLQSRILETVELILKEEGYGKLTMRRVADRCGIAVGTLYNYYSEKTEMIREIMLEDWNSTRATMDRESRKAGNLEEGIGIIYNFINGFVSRHRSTWGLMENSLKEGSKSAIRYSTDRFFADVDTTLSLLLSSVGKGFTEETENDSALVRELLINNIIFFTMKQNLDYDKVKGYLLKILS